MIARTDAAASEGLDGAVARAKLYREAGADAIFPEAMTSRAIFEEFARRLPDGARAELYATIRQHDHEALDASNVQTIIATAMPQR